MKKIVFVSHCLLNTASKVVLFNQQEIAAEEALRIRFLNRAIENGVQIIQLPCPEFTLYGADRWGHVSNQFDNVFFRKHCRKLLEPIIEQLKEYLAKDQRFEVLGIVGIDGSPSCGVDYSCSGQWFGSFEGRSDINETLETAALSAGRGIYMDELVKMLDEEDLKIKLTSLCASEPDKCLSILE